MLKSAGHAVHAAGTQAVQAPPNLRQNAEQADPPATQQRPVLPLLQDPMLAPSMITAGTNAVGVTVQAEVPDF